MVIKAFGLVAIRRGGEGKDAKTPFPRSDIWTEVKYIEFRWGKHISGSGNAEYFSSSIWLEWKVLEGK